MRYTVIDIVDIETSYCTVRTVIRNNEHWFVAADIVTTIGKTNIPRYYMNYISFQNYMKETVPSRKRKMAVNMLNLNGVQELLNQTVKHTKDEEYARRLKKFYNELVTAIGKVKTTSATAQESASEIEKLKKRVAMLEKANEAAVNRAETYWRDVSDLKVVLSDYEKHAIADFEEYERLCESIKEKDNDIRKMKSDIEKLQLEVNRLTTANKQLSTENKKFKALKEALAAITA